MNKLVTLNFDLSKPEDFQYHNAIEKISDTHNAIKEFKAFLTEEVKSEIAGSEDLKYIDSILNKYIEIFSKKGINI